MADAKGNEGLSIKIARGADGLRTQANWLYRMVSESQFLQLERFILDEYDYSLTGISVQRRADGWVVAVKAISDRNAWIAWIEVREFVHLAQVVSRLAYEGAFDWKHDKYPIRSINRRIGWEA